MLKDACVTLLNLVSKHGVPNDILLSVIKRLILPESTIPSSFRLLLTRDYLIPRHPVSSELVKTIIGIQLGKALTVSFSVYEELLKWLVIVYPFLEDSKIITKLYPILFFKLPYEPARRWVCHLLYLATCPALVTPWRIQLLTEYYSKSPNSPYILGLLNHFQSFKSDSAISGIMAPIDNLFGSPDPELEILIKRVQNNAVLEINCLEPAETELSKALNKFENIKLVIGASSPITIDFSNSSLERNLSPESFFSKFHTFKIPRRSQSIFLEGGLISRFIIYKNDPKLWNHFNSWLLEQLYSESRYEKESFSPTSHFESFLEKIYSFIVCTKTMPSAVEVFLYHYLSVWDGAKHEDIMFKLLSCLTMTDANTIQNSFLDKLECFMESRYPSKHIWVFNLLTELVKNWEIDQRVREDNSQDQLSLIEQCRTLTAVTSFINYYGIIAVENFKDNSSVALSILGYFRQVVTFPHHGDMAVVQIISTDLLYHLFLTQSLVSITICCGLLCEWKPLFFDNQRDEVSSQCYNFRTYLLDLCNSIWLNKAFSYNPTPKEVQIAPPHFSFSQKFIDILRETASKHSLNIDHMYGVSASYSFGVRAMDFFRKLEMGSAKPLDKLLDVPPNNVALEENSKEGGLPISFKSFRIKMLDQLAAEGFEGLHKFLYSFMRKLRSSKSTNST